MNRGAGSVKRILIVDDEPSILLSLSHLLKSKSVVVISSSNMEDAETALATYKFDLVIADLRLTGVDGIEGIELLGYVNEISPGTKVIIMTAYGSPEIREAALEKGAYHYYEKPIDIKDLLEKVERCGIPVSAGKEG
jgi:DNA-binding NtrC family response regulator